MGQFAWSRAAALGLFLGVSGCTDLDRDAEVRVKPGAAEGEASVDPHEAPGVWDHLPSFVNGGLRCGLGDVQGGFVSPRRLHGAAPESPIQLARAGQGNEGPECSAPGPLCAIFGPTETDKENHRLRKAMTAQRKWHEERTEKLREDVRQAEESREAERRSRLAQLRQLGQSSRGVYLTNDDSMSLASPQRLMWAIDHDAPLPSELVRPHELLNYFSFSTLPVNPDEVFSVLPELSPHPMRPSDYTLGFSVRGRAVTKADRRNVNLTYVMDRSGSMAGGDRIEMVKRGVQRSLRELKGGDIVSIILFDTTTCPLAQNFVVGRDSLEELGSLVDAVVPRGGSNLQDGLGQGFATANRSYQPHYSNRVLLLTDVEATGPSVDEKLIRLSARHYDTRRVRLSAVGVGDTVSDELLDRLTEAGKGASVFLSSGAELEAIFGTRFTSLVETVATNVHFKLELPPSISLRAFYGEEASEQKGRVQAVHFFSGTQQMYLANLEKSRPLQETDYIRLSIEYDDPESGEPKSSEFSWRADELEMATGEKSKFASRNLNKARMVATFGYQLRHMAQTYSHLLRPAPVPTWSLGTASGAQKRAEERAKATHHCRRVKGRLDAFSAQLGGEAEASRIVELWHRYCGRYEGEEPKLQLASGVTSPTKPSDVKETKLVALDKERINEFTPESDDFEP